MATINFPSSPTDGQVFTDGDHTWVFSSTGAGGPGAWKLEAQTVTGPTGPTGPTGAASTVTGPTGASVTGPTGPITSKNMLVNGNFKIWQRNTSTTTNLAYSADRWFINTNGTATATFSQIDTSAQSVGSQYGARVARSSGTDIFGIITVQEGALATVGKNVTLSGYMRKGSGLTSNVSVAFGTRASKFGAVSNSADITITNATLSTSTWYRFSTTMAVTTTTSTNSADLFEIELIALSQAGGANVHFEVASLQLEIGSAPSEFEQEDQSLTLLRCKRYYQTAATYVQTNGNQVTWVFPVTMRVNPALAGGGAGFTVDGASTTVGNWYQTTRAKNTLTLDSDF
jgi:hypothetical protein